MKSSNILKSIRTKRKCSQDDLANSLSISRQSYNTIENNLLNVDLDMLFKIFKELNASAIEIDEFLNVLKQDYMSYASIEQE